MSNASHYYRQLGYQATSLVGAVIGSQRPFFPMPDAIVMLIMRFLIYVNSQTLALQSILSFGGRDLSIYAFLSH
jgi:hypothetical protein